jgi:hypothetical protein
MKKAQTALIFCLIVFPSTAQTGGDNVYEFLNLSHSGLVTSLGGSNVSLAGESLNLSYHNPALLNHSMQRSIALNYVNYFAGINYGLAMYSGSPGRAGNFAAGVAYLNYGTFTGADPTGMLTGDFSASEYAFSLIWSYELDSMFSVGINIKPVLSHLEKYTSFGIASDIGGSYQSKNKRFSAGIVIRNAGLQVTSYAGEPRQSLPFEILAGISQKLAYAPVRYSVTFRHLQKYDLTHEYPETGINESSSSGEEGFAGNILRHVIPGIEFIPHKSFYVSAGYNIQRRKELRTVSGGSAAGFTWGFGINTAWMDIEFGRAVYHVAGASSNFSLILRPDKLYRKSR